MNVNREQRTRARLVNRMGLATATDLSEVGPCYFGESLELVGHDESPRQLVVHEVHLEYLAQSLLR